MMIEQVGGLWHVSVLYKKDELGVIMVMKREMLQRMERIIISKVDVYTYNFPNNELIIKYKNQT